MLFVGMHVKIRGNWGISPIYIYIYIYISEIKEAKQNKQRSLDVNFFGFLKRLLVHGSTIGSVVVVEQ